MHSFVVGLLTVLLVLDCVLLILLVLLQLPKKEAGAGVAFGGAATDALFGAGTGNVLTKITKYMAFGFFAMALALTILGAPKQTSSVFQEELAKKGAFVPSTNTLSKVPAVTPQPAKTLEATNK